MGMPDILRTAPEAVRFTRAFFETGKPVGAICHGPGRLIEAGVVEGTDRTSWPSLKTDIRNAGARWIVEEVHVDAPHRGRRLAGADRGHYLVGRGSSPRTAGPFKTAPSGVKREP